MGIIKTKIFQIKVAENQKRKFFFKFQNIMEDVFTRFPNIGHQIFVKLTNQELVKCRKVSKSLKIFVDKTKIMSARKIEKHCHPSYDQAWKGIIKQFEEKTIEILADDVESYFSKEKKGKMQSPLHFAA